LAPAAARIFFDVVEDEFGLAGDRDAFDFSRGGVSGLMSETKTNFPFGEHTERVGTKGGRVSVMAREGDGSVGFLSMNLWNEKRVWLVQRGRMLLWSHRHWTGRDLIDEAGRFAGQAATFSSWEFLPEGKD